MTYNANYEAYQQANQTIDQLQQVIMLYEGAIGFVKKAKEAIEAQDFQERYNMIERVLKITAALTSELEFNEQTNETAQALDNYYQGLEQRLLNIQCTDSLEDCDSVIRDLNVMLNAWRQVSQAPTEKATDQLSDSEASSENEDQPQQTANEETRQPTTQNDDGSDQIPPSASSSIEISV